MPWIGFNIWKTTDTLLQVKCHDNDDDGGECCFSVSPMLS